MGLPQGPGAAGKIRSAEDAAGTGCGRGAHDQIAEQRLGRAAAAAGRTMERVNSNRCMEVQSAPPGRQICNELRACK